MKKTVFLSDMTHDRAKKEDAFLLAEAHQLYPESEFYVEDWKSDLDWSKYDMAIIRSTWDYIKNPKVFLDKLKKLESLGLRICNPIDTVEWNMNKLYLLDLAYKGIRIIPTVATNSSLLKVASDVKSWNSHEVILKPVFGAGSHGVRRFETSILLNQLAQIVAENPDHIIQPFIERIFDGEFSYFYFDNKFSHSIVKVPMETEFRVQEEFGGIPKSVTPKENHLSFCEGIVSLNPNLLYQRIDFVEWEGEPHLMELELIEPSLYFAQSIEGLSNYLSAVAKLK
ncbi:MAG: hypothetical protein KDD25_06285 [Bdellovibrionales bacterium]|nr:hypothetical protein [Bdellovibrionales bacterium]